MLRGMKYSHLQFARTNISYPQSTAFYLFSCKENHMLTLNVSQHSNQMAVPRALRSMFEVLDLFYKERRKHIYFFSPQQI